MSLKNIVVIAKREYFARVKTKGFWIGTVALPLMLAALTVLPSLFLVKTRTTLQTVIVDETGHFGDQLAAEFEAGSDPLVEQVSRVKVVSEPVGTDTEHQRAELNRRVLAGEIGAWIWITEEGLADGEVEYHAESVSNFVTQSVLEDGISRVVRRHRLTQAGLDPEEIAGLVRRVGLSTVRVTEEGDRRENAFAGFIAAFALFMLLYVILILYGQQVLNGVLEEKTSRIVEVIVSTVRPFELMMGKLCGICAVALTQLGIWLGTLTVLTLPGFVAAMAWIPEDVDIPRMTPALALHFVLLFLLGFFLFASMYAAIGSAFNNVQEAQQAASVAVIFLVAPFFFMNSIINDPDSTVAVVASLIPVFTPLLMMLRIAVKTPPVWQLLLGYALTTACVFFMVTLAARIYRVGILMYGKKPTIQEIWRWLRYA